MIRTTRWIAWHLIFLLCITLAGCASSKPQAERHAATPDQVRTLLAETMLASDTHTHTAPALQQLEQSNRTASNAIKAITTARDVSVNNLSNAETAAFKRSDALIREDGKVTIRLDLTQGAMEATGDPLDLAIQGNGFFSVKFDGPIGTTGYTRAGNFVVNGRGNLVLGLGNGYELLPPITIPVNASSINIGTDGTIQYVKPGATVKSTAGQIKIAMFPNPVGLAVLGGSLYGETENSGKAAFREPGSDNAGILLSGNLEASNVDTVHEAVRLQSLNQLRSILLRAIGVLD